MGILPSVRTSATDLSPSCSDHQNLDPKESCLGLHHPFMGNRPPPFFWFDVLAWYSSHTTQPGSSQCWVCSLSEELYGSLMDQNQILHCSSHQTSSNYLAALDVHLSPSPKKNVMEIIGFDPFPDLPVLVTDMLKEGSVAIVNMRNGSKWITNHFDRIRDIRLKLYYTWPLLWQIWKTVSKPNWQYRCSLKAQQAFMDEKRSFNIFQWLFVFLYVVV